MNRATEWVPSSRSNRIFAGALAGLAGALAMSQFTRVWNAVLPSSSHSLPLSYSQQEWDATSKTARLLARRFFHVRLSSRHMRVGAQIVHYSVGSTAGALYVVISGYLSGVTKASGGLFGVALWVAGDELLMPALRISGPLRDYTPLMQAHSLGEHVAYALTTHALLRCMKVV